LIGRAGFDGREKGVLHVINLLVMFHIRYRRKIGRNLIVCAPRNSKMAIIQGGEKVPGHLNNF